MDVAGGKLPLPTTEFVINDPGSGLSVPIPYSITPAVTLGNGVTRIVSNRMVNFLVPVSSVARK